MSKKLKLSLLVALGIAILGISGYFGYQEYIAKKDLLSAKQIIKNIGSKFTNAHSKDQVKLTKTYKQALNGLSYTLDNPYVKVNPYETSPLTALVLFQTTTKAKVSYTVKGQSKKTTLTNTVNAGYTTKHQVPIVGLYANYENTVEIKVTYKDKTVETKTLTLKTDALPEYLDENDIKVTKKDTAKMDLGNNKLTVINRTTKQPYAVDSDGKIRWYSTNWSQHTIEQLKNGHLLIQTKLNNSATDYNYLVEQDYLGRVYKEYEFNASAGNKEAAGYPATVIHHDVTELPNGDLVATVNDGQKRYVEDTIAIISHKTGKVIKVIDFKRILPAQMYLSYKEKTDSGQYDWLHINAVDYDKSDGGLLISARNQDLIMKINLETNKINWIYCSKQKTSWSLKYRNKLLTKTDNTAYTGGQHGLTLLAHNGSSEKILLYDNNIAVTNGDKTTSGQYSQAVEYKIDTKKMTITQTFAYGKTLGKANFTSIIGYAQRLSNQNTLIDFGYKNAGQESNIIEVDSKGKEVFNMTLSTSAQNKTYAYRAYRWEFYPSNYVFDLNTK